jgi:hypothetical protein
MADLISVFQKLEEFGLTDVLLPFLLIFSVMYAILGTIQIFGAKGKNINIIVALVMALLVVVPHVTGTYPAGQDIVEIINTSIPNVSVVIIAVIMVLMLIGVFGVRVDLLKSSWIASFVPLIALGIVFFIFGRSAGWFAGGSLPSWLSFLDDPDTVAVILVILVFVIIIGFITGDGGEGKRLGQGIKDVVGEFGKILTR